MQKITYLFSLLLCLMLGTTNAAAQIWIDGDGSAALGTNTNGQYAYTSPEFTPEGGTTPTKLRFVFLSTSSTGSMDTSGRHPYVHFSEFYLYDKDDNRVTLSESNFSSNATQPGEGSIGKLCDGFTTRQDGEGQYDWYWHSFWGSTPHCDHYLEVTVPDGTDLSTFKYGFVSRNTSCIPTKVMVLGGETNITAHNALNAEEVKYETEISSYPSDGGRTDRAWAAVKAAFQSGNASPDMTDYNTAVNDRKLTLQHAFHTLSIADQLTSTTRNNGSGVENCKAYDGSSSAFTIPAGVGTLRISVKDTNTHDSRNGHVFFTLAELTVNVNGTQLNLASCNPSSNADHNALNPSKTDGGGLAALYDGNLATFFHTAYENGPNADHYVQFDIDPALATDGTMYISFTSRNNNNVPTVIEFWHISDAVTARYAAAASLNQRIGELLGSTGDEPGYYEPTAIETATAAALAVLRNSASTTEELTAALAALNTAAASALNSFSDGTKAIFGNKLHTTRFVYARTTDNLLGDATGKDNYRYLWTLKKVGQQTFKLYNEYTNKYVGAVPTSNNVRFPLVDDEASATVFTIAPAATEGYYNIYNAAFSDQTRSALHATNWDGVVRWGKAADASQFSIITDVDATCTAWDNALINKVNGLMSDNTHYGKIKTETTELTTAISNLQSTSSVDNYKALETALLNAEYVLPEPEKIYQIVAKTSDHNKRHNGDLVYANPVAVGAGRFTAGTDRSLKHNLPAEIHIPNSYWKFETAAVNNQMYLRHVNSGLYAGQLSTGGTTAEMPLEKDNAGLYSFNYLSAHEAYMLFEHTNASFLNDAHASENIVGWNDSNDEASRWTIEEVTSVPVTISTIRYATLNLPFAVNIPENVKAYIGSAEGTGYVKLEEITGVIPANTAVILVSQEDLGAAKQYDFTVAYNNSDAAPDNKLSGTTTAETIETSATAYILKNGGAGIGLYRVESTTDRTIPANKAYYGTTLADSEGTSAMLGFRFGDVTSISQIETSNNGSEALYDLNGRRVLYPAHGVFVKANGEKIFIK